MKIKNQEGAVTAYVLIAMVVFTTIAVGFFVMSANRQQTQLEAFEQVKKIYANGEMENTIAMQYVGGDIIPIYTEEQLKKIGSGESIYIDGKNYIFSTGKTYVLQNDVIFNETNESKFSVIQGYIQNNNTIIEKQGFELKVINSGVKRIYTMDDKFTTPTYIIENASDLASFRDSVNSGNTYEGQTIEILADIDLKGSETNQWVPIGDSNNKFKGIFNGNYHKIDNIYINTGIDHCGFFGYVSNGTIKKIIINSGSITSTAQRGGALVGKIDSSTILECGNYVSSIGAYYNGGLIGEVSSGSNEIVRCFNSGNVSSSNGSDGYSGIGGIIGSCDGSVNIYDSYNTGNINCTGYRAGGIIGSFWMGDPSNQRNIYNCYNMGSLTTGGYGGEITGSSNGKMIINNCFYYHSNNYYGQQSNGTPSISNIMQVTGTQLKAKIDDLNSKNWITDTDSLNINYPILSWQLKYLNIE